MPVEPETIAGAWLHSHEEDSDGEMVFRPKDYPFPPSRGRIGFGLSPDGAATLIGIAPADGPSQEAAHWTLSQDSLLIHTNDRGTLDWRVLESTKDRLVLAPPRDRLQTG